MLVFDSKKHDQNPNGKFHQDLSSSRNSCHWMLQKQYPHPNDNKGTLFQGYLFHDIYRHSMMPSGDASIKGHSELINNPFSITLKF